MSDFRSLDELDLSEFRKGTDFDLVIIGSGPAGQRAAITGAKQGARVAMIERDPLAGGVCLNTGTIPSKSLREAILYLTGYRQRGYYGDRYRLKDKIQTGDLLDRTNHVVQLEREDINETLVKNGVTRLVGTGKLKGPNEIVVSNGALETVVKSDKIILCVGTKPRRPPEVPFDETNIFDSDNVFGLSNNLRPLPDRILVMGAGVIGIEYASMFAALEIPVDLMDPRPSPLDFVDDEIAQVLYRHLERSGVKQHFGTTYDKIEILGEPRNPTSRVRAVLKNGETVESDSLLFCLGRVPLTEAVGTAEVGIALDRRGHIVVDGDYRTSVPSIYAAGDVIGFPALASTSAEQGRVAAMHALGLQAEWHPDLIPYGIYTIPEISMAGKTEQQLVTEGVPFFKGTALWRDTARGKILGDLTGALKMLFHGESRRLLGVHIIGEGATELLHIGQAVMHFGGGPEYFQNTVFNYPTLAEAYKIAAYNAANRLVGKSFHTAPLVDQVAAAAPRPEEYLKF